MYRQKAATIMWEKHYNIEYQNQEATKHKNACNKKQFGTNLQESVDIFHDKISKGCIYVCSMCHQTEFEDSHPCKQFISSAHSDLLKECLSGHESVNQREYICLPCKTAIYKGQIPKLSLKTNVAFQNNL